MLEHAFRLQQSPPCFPVTFEQLGAKIEFVRLEPDKPFPINGLTVTPHLQLHGGDSYGYRLTCGGRTVVYSTDSEHKLNDPAEMAAFAEFFRAADLVIFDSMYSLADTMSVKADWGHSSNIAGVELCQLAGARQLCLFHHEPMHDDEAIDRLLAETRRIEEITRTGEPLLISAAYDGMEIRW